MSELTDKQRQFVGEYLIDFNATQACIRAGYSKNTAKEQGYENLTKPHIQELLQGRMKERQERTQITQKMVLERLWEEGNDFEKGTPNSRVSATSWLGKHFSLFTDNIAVENKNQEKVNTDNMTEEEKQEYLMRLLRK